VIVCAQCKQTYKGEYEVHMQTKQHLKSVVKGAAGDKLELQYEHLTNALENSKNKNFQGKVVCRSCLGLIKATKLGAHMESHATPSNYKPVVNNEIVQPST